MRLSVVVPTYNRGHVLIKCLDALYQQRGLKEGTWEIIVVDDGSTDGTGPMVRDLARASPVPLTYLCQENSGPAAARNRGIRAATAPLVLMIDDDVLATVDLLAQHVRAHEQFPTAEVAVLGRLEWVPTLKVTPFMEWWIENRFRFGALSAGRETLDFTFFYTCNISVKRAFLMEHGLFDESFRAAAYEDSELAYRLEQAGLEMRFVPQASAYHDHAVDLETACRQIENVGLWSPRYEAKTHSWSAPPKWIRFGRYLGLVPGLVDLLRAWAERRQTRSAAGWLYAPVMMHYFWLGRRRAVTREGE